MEREEKHPPWSQPQNDQAFKGLYVYNSLTDTKVPFVPKEGNTIKWYICGPTVYDSTHMGHARTYLAFDIIRRILQDYFGYDIFCVMNITDVDDKIILKARRNYLFRQYLEKKVSYEQVVADVEEAIAKAEAKFEKKQAELKGKLDAAKAAKDSRKINELEEVIGTDIVKHKAVTSAREIFTAFKSSGSKDNEELLYKVQDVIAVWLDDKFGESEFDQAIFRAHAEKYEKEYFDDITMLGIQMPDVITRVTEYIPEIIAFVDKIIDNGFAYESAGSVYFDTNAFIEKKHAYAKLKPSAVGNQSLAEEGEGALSIKLGDKKHPNDFALWKASKPGEPFWESKWGKGRPGWHIECSAMAGDILGSNLDIHCGGIDLTFPHHDNELAQAEAFFGNEQWVNYFLHTGHLYIQDQKMSKSLKNFFTIRDILKVFSARQFRLMFLMYHWHDRMNYSVDAMEAVVTKEKLFKDFFQNVSAANREQDRVIEKLPQHWDDNDKTFKKQIDTRIANVDAALKDNFNTPAVMLQLSELVGEANSYLMLPSYKICLIKKAAAHISKMFHIFGIDSLETVVFQPYPLSTPDVKLSATLDMISALRDEVRGIAKEKGGFSKDKLQPALDNARHYIKARSEELKLSDRAWSEGALIEQLEGFVNAVGSAEASNTLLELCDQLRDIHLPKTGVRLEDRSAPLPSVWKLEHPDVMQKEYDAKVAAARDQALKKLKNKLDQQLKDMKKWEVAAEDPKAIFKTGEFSEFDENGFPTLLADGAKLSGSKKSNLEKELKKRQKANEEYLAKGADFLPSLRAAVDKLQQQIKEEEAKQ